MSLDRLIKACVEMKNPTVVGLDPALDLLPPQLLEAHLLGLGDPLEGAAEAVLEFNRSLIDGLHDLIPAVKPQAAYYEALGWRGMRTLEETIRYAQKKGLYVIIDAKRNDIGSTMEAYTRAHLGLTQVGGESVETFGGDALTVNGYLGTDGINPLLETCRARDKGIFVLVKTSNPSSGELQDRVCDGRPVYELMGSMCEEWGKGCPGNTEYGYSGVGAVVGATWPEQLAALRKKLPHTFFLVPGYGAQGGRAEDLAGAFDAQGVGAVINSSRAVLAAWKKEGNPADYVGAARREALRMRQALSAVCAGGSFSD